MQTAFMFIYTETSLHAGTGSTVSVVDLPIQRERTTQYPLIQGSGVKGALRNQYRGGDAEMLFGPETQKADVETYAGALSVGDARIVLFPVRSLSGVFAYVTCNQVLARLGRDLAFGGVGGFPAISQVVESGNALTTTQNNVEASGRVVLEEFSFVARRAEEVDALAAWLAHHALPAGEEYAYWRHKVGTSLVVLPDDDFRDFVVNSTEVTTRVRLDPATKTVQTGALWTQESLPSDTLLMSTIVSRGSRNGKAASAQEVLNLMIDHGLDSRVQIGGDETTGQGFVSLRWLS